MSKQPDDKKADLAIANSTRTDLFRLTGLISACPVTQDNPPECPLFKMRAMAGTRLAQWLFTRTHQEIVAIEHAHAECYRLKRQADRALGG